jgi:3'(2'), 5'-bisphosphate nucleotidase
MLRFEKSPGESGSPRFEETHLEAMLPAARAAGRICRHVQEALATPDALTKGDRSPVTVADFAAQAVISRRLADRFPDIPLVGEEDCSAIRESGAEAVLAAVIEAVRREWPGAGEAEVCRAIDRGKSGGGADGLFFVLDPIDGTKGFLRGDQYAVALSILRDGRPVAGVLACPNLPGPAGSRGSLFAAALGSGAAVADFDDEGAALSPLAVSPEEDPARTRFCESVEKAHSHRGRSALVAERMGVTAEPVRIDSQCKYGLVARGDAELYLRIPRDEVYREKIWDHAAGALIVTEAGGTVTDIDGRPLDFSHGRRLERNRGVVASNGRIHEEVLSALRHTE